MAERRMFAKTIIDSDAFLDMPMSAQLLYFHLSMRADDDGFINNPKKIQRVIGCADDDARILVSKKFIIPFETGIVVIKHWKIHNYIAKDRYHETKYKEEKAQLALDDNQSYTTCIQDVDKLSTQVRLGKVRLGKDSKEQEKKQSTPKPIKKRFEPPTKDDVVNYAKEKGYILDPQYFYDYYSQSNWEDVKGNKIKNWKLKMLTWEKREEERNPNRRVFTKQPAKKRLIKCEKCGSIVKAGVCTGCGSLCDTEGNLVKIGE